MAFSPWGPSPFLGGGQWLGGHQSLWHQTTLASVNCLCVYPGTYMSKAYSSVNGATWQVVQWYSLFIQQQSQHSFSCFYGPYATQKIWEIAWGKGFFFFFFLHHFYSTALSYHAGHKRTRRSCLFLCFIRKERREIHCFLVSQISQMDYSKLKDPFRVQSIFKSF